MCVSMDTFIKIQPIKIRGVKLIQHANIDSLKATTFENLNLLETLRFAAKTLKSHEVVLQADSFSKSFQIFITPRYSHMLWLNT